MIALWRGPGRVLPWNHFVVAADLLFALLLIHFTGGARSILFLALLLISGIQAYYYGVARGLGVAVAAGAAYVLVAWPTMDRIEWANTAIRLVVLTGTAIGVGILAHVEESERTVVATLTTEARSREQLIRSVIESLGEGLVTLDLAGQVTGWNRAMQERSGVPAHEAMGHRFLDRFPAYAREGLAEPLGRLLDGTIETLTLPSLIHETPHGQVVQNLTGTLLRQGGEPAGAVLLIQDITERVALERSARQGEKLAALGTLAAGLAHELNNPIGIISSRIEIMLLDAEAEPLPTTVMEDLRVLHRHAQRVARIAQGLLSFARQSPGQRGPVDLNHLVEETLLFMGKQVGKGGIAVRRALTPGLPLVWGDENALQQVVVNLLTNARDALTHGGEITVRTRALPGESSAVSLIVSDSGPGIPADVLPRIFDPFFTTKPDGTGLGLSISYGIVREHQGTMDVQSTPGEGATFILTFPAVRTEVTAGRGRACSSWTTSPTWGTTARASSAGRATSASPRVTRAGRFTCSSPSIRMSCSPTSRCPRSTA
jgi:PAS domain S-box-containing protein